MEQYPAQLAEQDKQVIDQLLDAVTRAKFASNDYALNGDLVMAALKVSGRLQIARAELEDQHNKGRSPLCARCQNGPAICECATDGPKIRVKAEAYEHRIYELEVAFMMELDGTPESAAAKERMERVTASYYRYYPGRPLNPKPKPSQQPNVASASFGPPAKKPRKPYTKRPA
ncbi:hypothetical protein [Hymenobacter lapidiphilus]|uniref:Uncharacterized protein n=1 Tax=Hymenobacter lapidiphilus TaxID=2608003 RepID=A0A7Y7U8E0_9BACT|nr:hypothetical protein [Hymenobacter lapidiphilus]NVO33480.1 hypothetical protein [Hymenobacter lapidiphilus]